MAFNTLFGLSTIYFYIILKQRITKELQEVSLSTIYFYIILKHAEGYRDKTAGLSTIYFYIILKPQSSKMKCHHPA